MSEKESSHEERLDDTEIESRSQERPVPERVAIEGDLPLTAIDIESQKDMMSGRYHPLRSLDKWFAARPTPAVRLSALASAYPGDINPDKLLSLMQIGPKERETNIANYVEQKYRNKESDKESGENLDEYYGYSNPNSQTPTNSELKKLHNEIKEEWGGELPTIIDPTAGRGIIPFEASRYGFPVISNDYDPNPVLINKVALEYAPQVGSVSPEINRWTERIIEKTQERISEYYPTEESGREILNSAMTYIVTCNSCGGDVPLTGKWWLNKTSNGGDAILPHYEDGEVEYEHIKVQENDNFDPSDAPVSRGGDAECPHCSVLIDADTIREQFRKGEFEYSVYGVNYETSNGERGFRAGTTTDQEALEDAAERVESDFEMLDFYSEQYHGGDEDRVKNYGVEQWRDIFTPRQLIAHYELFQIVDDVKGKVLEEYSNQKAELIMTLLAMAIDRQVQHNCTLAQWRDSRGYGSYVFSNNNFAMKRMFVDNNIRADRRGLSRHFEHVIEDSYELVAQYAEDIEPAKGIYNVDAADISETVDSDSVEIAIVDPPYFENIMYGELSDFSYLTKKYILSDVFPDLFDSKLVNKEEQAVANPERHENNEEFYENKMYDILDCMSEILSDDGILTLMFTDREIRAWNAISKAVIRAGFTITATHPIKTEMGDRIVSQDRATVNSSILLIARNNSGKREESRLWEEIEGEIEKTARKEAKRILSIDDVDKVDASIAAFGPALEEYSESYPIENKQGELIDPGRVLAKARQEVTSVIASDELNTETDTLDGLTRWYILCYTIYGDADIPFDEANQLGMGADVEITELKTPTKIWSKSSGNVDLNDHTDRIQDIAKLRSDKVDNPSSDKYPVNPTETMFTYAIDAVHAALHVYEREGPQFTRDWLAERGFKNDTAFTTTVKALLEAVPSDTEMHDTLTDLISGETGDYLDISVSGLNITNNSETQTGLEEFE